MLTCWVTCSRCKLDPTHVERPSGICTHARWQSQATIGNVVKSCLESVEWWLAWQAEAKAVCQWLGSANHREVLQNRLRSRRRGMFTLRAEGSQSLEAMIASLNRTCDRFADWRWKAFADVTRALLRMEDGVRSATRGIADSVELQSRSLKLVRQVLAVVGSPTFWARVRALLSAIAPLSTLSSWLRGCFCHEVHRLCNIKVGCPCASCRAFELASKLRAANRELRSARDSGVPSGFDVPNGQWHSLLVNMVSIFQLKFAWAHCAPFTVWTIVDAPSARGFIEEHDRAVLAGERVHRVTHYLAGKDAWTLRHDLQSFARSGRYTDRLWAEL